MLPIYTVTFEDNYTGTHINDKTISTIQTISIDAVELAHHLVTSDSVVKILNKDNKEISQREFLKDYIDIISVMNYTKNSLEHKIKGKM